MGTAIPKNSALSLCSLIKVLHVTVNLHIQNHKKKKKKMIEQNNCMWAGGVCYHHVAMIIINEYSISALGV